MECWITSTIISGWGVSLFPPARNYTRPSSHQEWVPYAITICHNIDANQGITCLFIVRMRLALKLGFQTSYGGCNIYNIYITYE